MSEVTIEKIDEREVIDFSNDIYFYNDNILTENGIIINEAFHKIWENLIDKQRNLLSLKTDCYSKTKSVEKANNELEYFKSELNKIKENTLNSIYSIKYKK